MTSPTEGSYSCIIDGRFWKARLRIATMCEDQFLARWLDHRAASGYVGRYE
jgi:hypothetical protein